MARRTKLVLTVMATVIGGLSLLLFTTLAKDIFFANVNFCSSSVGALTLKTMAIFSAGIVAGFMSSLIVVRDNLLPHLVISGLVILKMCFVVSCGQMGNPVWFDTLLDFSLIPGLWLGCYGAIKFPLAPI